MQIAPIKKVNIVKKIKKNQAILNLATDYKNMARNFVRLHISFDRGHIYNFLLDKS